ncbi:MAG: argininosuccinate lyase [Candidatus Omnitrophica bacterium]|nr:argininosuccinate lyase [Candidatus Omnitrophota bacterium]
MTKKLWGGRFKSEQDPVFWQFQSSIDYDKELAEYDIEGSIAHVKMLDKAKIIPKKQAQSLLKVLSQILKSIQNNTFKIDPKAEDIHTAIYLAIKKKLDKTADYLHTARSRNDQVVLDLRMYCKDKLSLVISQVKKLQLALVNLAKSNMDVVIPGLTHTQHAVPILLSHQILAYVSMLERDAERLSGARERSDEMPLGSCALAGTSFTIDRKYVAKLLGFSTLSENSIDAVSDRDFVIEALSATSIMFMHISRFCEDMILFATSEFDFIDISEAYCTGSSIMPQKKNPDALELIRGASSKAYANLNSCLVMMKGLPLAYNRDMQLDKEPLFSSIKLSEDALTILTGLVKTLKIKRESIVRNLEQDQSIFALDIADYLVNKKMPFTEAHKVTGKIVAYAIDKNLKISNLPIAELKKFAKEFGEDIYKVFDAKRSVMSKRSIGSTNPLLVRQQIDKWLKKLKG